MTEITLDECNARTAELREQIADRKAQLKLWNRRKNRLRMIARWADPERRRAASERTKDWARKRDYQKLPPMDQATYWRWRKLRKGGAHSREEALRMLALSP